MAPYPEQNGGIGQSCSACHNLAAAANTTVSASFCGDVTVIDGGQAVDPVIAHGTVKVLNGHCCCESGGSPAG